MDAAQMLEDCTTKARRYLKALEKTQAEANNSSQGLAEQELAELVARSLQYHQRLYSLWMQCKLDHFAEVPWDHFGITDIPSAGVSRTPSGTGELCKVCCPAPVRSPHMHVVHRGTGRTPRKHD